MIKTTLSKTAAYKAAAAAHGAPVGRGTSWQIFVPYYSTQLNGPTSSREFDSYSKAVADRARDVAFVALELMGYSTADAWQLTEGQTGSARNILNDALRRQPNPNA